MGPLLLSREAILGADDLKTEDVPVPEWGGSVRIRQMTGAERSEFQKATFGESGTVPTSPNAYRLNLFAATVIDQDGNRMFTAADAAALDAKNSVALDRVAIAADKLNAMTEAKVEVAQKNS